MVDELAETINENDPASPPRYHSGLRDVRKDGRSIAVTEFISIILAGRTNRSLRCFGFVVA